MKFKVGDEVYTPNGNGVIVYIDLNSKILVPYLVKIEGFKGHHGGNRCAGFVNTDATEDKWWFYEYSLDLIKPDLRDLLQGGFKVVFRDESFLINHGDETIDTSYFDKDLYNKTVSVRIDKIYRPKYNGLKPMTWELIWKREEEQLFTLELPGNVKNKYYCHGIVGSTFDYRFDEIIKENITVYQNKFTQSEIDNLPNQEFIKTLIQKPV